MNDETTLPPLPGTDATQPEVAQPAKVRKPRTRKIAAVADGAVDVPVEAAAATSGQVVAAEADAMEKPKRARRPRKPIVDAAEGAEVPAVIETGAERAAEASVPVAASSVDTAAHVDGQSEVHGEADEVVDGGDRQDGPGKRRRKLRSKYGVGGGDRRRRDDDQPSDAAETVEQEAGSTEVPSTLFSDVISGQFDADEADENLPLPKRVLDPQPETPKLHKVLAQAGMGSRLEMEQLISEGKITVNNEPAHVGQRIQFGDRIKVNGKPIRFNIAPPPPRVLAYHKPVGEVVTHDDPQNRPTVFRRLPKLHQGKWQSVGRLDLNTEGLLLFTSSGELANRLMHPRFGLQREYAVRVLGALSQEEKQQLLDGVELDDGVAQFQSIEDGGGDGANCWYRVTISEGRNREVRRLIESVGHAVSRLIRIRYGAMMLPRGLKRGAWLELDERDIRSLTQASGGPLTSEAIHAARQSQGRGNRQARGRNADRRNQGGGQSGERGERFDGDKSFQGRQGSQGHAGGDRAGQGKPRFGKDGNRGRNPSDSRESREPREPRGERAEKQPTADAYMQSHSLAQIRGRRRGYDNDGLPGGRGKGGNGGQPDPMRTSVGYIGADSFSRGGRGGGGGFGGNGYGGGNGQRRGGGNGGRGGRSR